MNVLRVYLRLYADCARKTFASLGKNLWTLALPGVLMLAYKLLTLLLVSLLPGVVVGFVIGFVMAAGLSCYLYFLGEVVGNSRVRVQDFGVSVRAYLWSVVNVMFVLWVARFVGDLLLRGMPNGDVIWTALSYAALIAFNAVPEVIYQRGTYGGLATFQRSLQFLQENWIEWGLPNLALVAGIVKLLGLAAEPVALLGLRSAGTLGFLLMHDLLLGALVHLFMVYRGHLFAALDGSSHRQRMFKFRNAL